MHCKLPGQFVYMLCLCESHNNIKSCCNHSLSVMEEQCSNLWVCVCVFIYRHTDWNCVKLFCLQTFKSSSCNTTSCFSLQVHTVCLVCSISAAAPVSTNVMNWCPVHLRPVPAPPPSCQSTNLINSITVAYNINQTILSWPVYLLLFSSRKPFFVNKLDLINGFIHYGKRRSCNYLLLSFLTISSTQASTLIQPCKTRLQSLVCVQCVSFTSLVNAPSIQLTYKLHFITQWWMFQHIN